MNYQFSYLNDEIQEHERIRNSDYTDAMIFDWVMHMVQLDNPLREIVALFWHNHVPCGKGNSHNEHSRLALEIYRKYGLDELSLFLKKISSTPSMLYFLDAHHSHKDNPNENFSRELMEYFTLGRGNFSFQDVKEASRAFTGRRFNHHKYPYELYLDEEAFDNENKNILGKIGNWNGEDVIDILLEDYNTAKHISKSALSFFVTENPPEKIINECADVYFKSGYKFIDLLKHIFFSDWFFENSFIKSKVKTPVQLLVDFQRRVGLRCVGIKTVNYFLKSCGQKLFQPPDVSGWPSGVDWLVGSELINRVLLPSSLINISNRKFSRDTYFYKLYSRINYLDIRSFRYIADCIFDINKFYETLKKERIPVSNWMDNKDLKSEDIFRILKHPKNQYC